jgi:hypothetical protein
MPMETCAWHGPTGKCLEIGGGVCHIECDFSDDDAWREQLVFFAAKDEAGVVSRFDFGDDFF